MSILTSLSKCHFLNKFFPQVFTTSFHMNVQLLFNSYYFFNMDHDHCRRDESSVNDFISSE